MPIDGSEMMKGIGWPFWLPMEDDLACGAVLVEVLDATVRVEVAGGAHYDVDGVTAVLAFDVRDEGVVVVEVRLRAVRAEVFAAAGARCACHTRR